ncbi:MAG: lysophospholipid acyltransferase family protein [Planctomycetota bacterium]|jgi:1-acyl-sn-glycerol-3-phosphate acyltransferase
MPSLRVMLRVLGLVAATLFWTGMFCVGYCVAGPIGRRLALRDWIVHRWARSVLRVLGIRVEVHGTVPAGGCLLVSNHISYVDIFVLASLRPVAFLSKSEVAHWPGIGLVTRIVGIRFIDRSSRRGLPTLGGILVDEARAGHGMIFFPEGTTTEGVDLLPFRPALLSAAADQGFPVHYAALAYRTPDGCPPAEKAVAWVGDDEFVPHMLAFLRLPRVRVAVHLGSEPAVEHDRKALAARLEAAVRAGLGRARSSLERGNVA